MKTRTSILAHFKAFFILLVSGWRSYIFYPPQTDMTAEYIVMLENRTIHHLMHFKFTDGSEKWENRYKSSPPPSNKIIYWKPMPKPFFACR